jgi:hypothetical protein
LRLQGVAEGVVPAVVVRVVAVEVFGVAEVVAVVVGFVFVFGLEGAMFMLNVNVFLMNLVNPLLWHIFLFI